MRLIRIAILESLFLLGVFGLGTAFAQTPCPSPCSVVQNTPFTVQWDLNAASGGPTAEYRLYMGIQGGAAPVVVQRIAVGSPAIVNGVITLPQPNGTNAPVGTYVLLLGAANGISDAAVETRSDPIVMVVTAPPTTPPPPAKPTGGRFTKP